MLNTFNASYEVLSRTYFSRMTIPTPSLSSHRASEAEVQQMQYSWLLLVEYWYETVHELNTQCTLLLRRSVRWRKGACRLVLCLITEYTGRNSRRSDGGNTGGMGCEGHKSSVPVHGHKHKGHQCCRAEHLDWSRLSFSHNSFGVLQSGWAFSHCTYLEKHGHL